MQNCATWARSGSESRSNLWWKHKIAPHFKTPRFKAIVCTLRIRIPKQSWHEVLPMSTCEWRVDHWSSPILGWLLYYQLYQGLQNALAQFQSPKRPCHEVVPSQSLGASRILKTDRGLGPPSSSTIHCQTNWLTEYNCFLYPDGACWEKKYFIC
jgi:hypothetical protein